MRESGPKLSAQPGRCGLSALGHPAYCHPPAFLTAGRQVRTAWTSRGRGGGRERPCGIDAFVICRETTENADGSIDLHGVGADIFGFRSFPATFDVRVLVRAVG